MIPTPTTARTAVAAVTTTPPTLASPSALLPGQVEFVGGAAPTAVAAIVVFFVAVVLSVVVTYRYATGYLRTRQRPLLYLTIGMLLLAPAPMFVRLLLGNVAVLSTEARTLAVTVSKLCGLLVILSVVYQR
jgi:uncharacterized membrane protein YtjA (UPF0391 family)